MALMLLWILFRTDRADVKGNESSRFVCDFFFCLFYILVSFSQHPEQFSVLRVVVAGVCYRIGAPSVG